MSRPTNALRDINADIGKVSKRIIATDDVNVQNALFKLLRILKSWREVLKMQRRGDANDTETTI